jgi:hypothetical protein
MIDEKIYQSVLTQDGMAALRSRFSKPNTESGITIKALLDQIAQLEADLEAARAVVAAYARQPLE